MLSKQDNETLTRVGPGTTMGELMREYWIPALMSSELPNPDSDPVRVRLLGENLVAFRDTTGTVGLIDNYCPHRRASLFFGRNEESGIRCVYHGWKYDISGNCVDMPSEPAESNFKDKVKITAYPCQERNGVIWTYMGTRTELPPLPDLEPNMRPDREYSISTVLRECNWMQGLEGDIDTAHLGFLHLGSADPKAMVPGTTDYYTVNVRHPRYNVKEMDYGVMYAAYRPAEEDSFLLALCSVPAPLLHDDPHRHAWPHGPRPRLGPRRRHPHHVLEHERPDSRGRRRRPPHRPQRPSPRRQCWPDGVHPQRHRLAGAVALGRQLLQRLQD